MSTIDYTQAPKAVLMALINLRNNTNLDVSDFEIGAPIPCQDAARASNTQVTITPVAGTGFYGDRTIYYDRLDLGIFNTYPAATIPINELTLYEYLPVLNALYDLHLTEADVYDAPIPAFDPANPTLRRELPVIAKADSFFFQGSYTFSFGTSNLPLPEMDGVIRRFYLYIDGLSITDVKKSLISLNANGTTNTDFTFLVNATSIDAFEVTRVYRRTDGSFVLNGNFTLVFMDGQGVPRPVSTAKGLLVSATGRVTGSSMFTYFDTPGKSPVYEAVGVPFKYVIDDADLTQQCRLYRFDEQGVTDRSFAPEITYRPEFVRITRTGKIYTISAQFVGADPHNNNLPAKLMRIDRLLPTGSFDPAFYPVFIGVSNATYAVLPIFDLCEMDTGGFSVVFKPVATSNIGSVSPVINGRKILQVDPVNNPLYSWNPVAVFNADGSQNTQFSDSLKSFSSNALYVLDSSLEFKDTSCLYARGNLITFMTYRMNPMTGFSHRQPIQFDLSGALKLLSGQRYIEQYRFVDLKHTLMQTNGVFVAYGVLQTLQASGTYSAPYSAVVVYHADGTIHKTLWRSPGASAGALPQVTQVFLEEQ